MVHQQLSLTWCSALHHLLLGFFPTSYPKHWINRYRRWSRTWKKEMNYAKKKKKWPHCRICNSSIHNIYYIIYIIYIIYIYIHNIYVHNIYYTVYIYICWISQDVYTLMNKQYFYTSKLTALFLIGRLFPLNFQLCHFRRTREIIGRSEPKNILDDVNNLKTARITNGRQLVIVDLLSFRFPTKAEAWRFNPFPPRAAKSGHFVILLCVTPDDFTRQRRASGWERVKRKT